MVIGQKTKNETLLVRLSSIVTSLDPSTTVAEDMKILSAVILDFELPVTSFSMDDSAVDLGD
jgi:hypothetical protein